MDKQNRQAGRQTIDVKNVFLRFLFLPRFLRFLFSQSFLFC